MHPAVAEGLTHGPCPYPPDTHAAASWHFTRSLGDAGGILATALQPALRAVAALQGTQPVMRGAVPRYTWHDEAPGLWSVSPGLAMTYDGKDAVRERTSRPPADPRLRGGSFRSRGRR